ncbi:GntR family transcriptional regulator [Scopulibacillus darangshiensis]|uniref:GntR family transcriptional regulator n=1 Tax=Scopulibacillus darangshiensis TaxID=442528 RepID=A0A4R2P7L4_9BACL|nr:GntR family transcriptional regulator [Scopulibacillus darangshiensis]TCP30893.1 GntR family transcriptional regulator [Scopulibacillus darangshiensis]
MNNKNESKQQKAYNVMKSRIIKGVYAPGQRIIINQLAKELHTSAIPIREAIRQLEAEGLIEYHQHIGAVVTPIDESEYLDTLSVLAVMEGYATAISRDFFPKEKIFSLQELNEHMKGALEDFDFVEFGRLNREFHELTCHYCTNDYLVETIRKTWRRLDSIRVEGSALTPKRVQESIQEHEKIIELMGKSDASFQEVETAVRTHKLNTVIAFEKQKDKGQSNHFLNRFI